MLKPATAIRKFVGTDCCENGRLYFMPTVQEIKDFKEACSYDEYKQMGEAAARHLAEHEGEEVG